jgi:hypothetical protein
VRKSVAFYGTVIVVAHLLANIAHGMAHSQLHIGLSPAGTLFVGVVILVCPLLAMVLLWMRQRKIGLVLLGLSMTASMVFGLYHHFGVAGIDQVGHQGSGVWATTFAMTAWLLAITEAAGAFFALYFLAREPTAPPS